jgi:hypothetical protein
MRRQKVIIKNTSALGGVYDSPAATDFYVRQFGFMFGGGRSGVLGLKAMQVTSWQRAGVESWG